MALPCFSFNTMEGSGSMAINDYLLTKKGTNTTITDIADGQNVNIDGSETVQSNLPLDKAYYWEFQMESIPSTNGVMVGILEEVTNYDTYHFNNTNSSLYSNGGVKYPESTSGFSTFTNGDIIGVAVDPSVSIVYFYKNGVLEFEETYAFIPYITITSTLNAGTFAKLNFINEKSGLSFEPSGFNLINKSLILLSDGSYRYSREGSSQTPTMTSNTTPSGVASASSVIGVDNEPYKVFDDMDDTYGWATSSGTTTGWLSYDFEKSMTIIRYTILPINNSNILDSAPKDWTFEGFDGVSWTVLDTQTNITNWNISTKKEFSFANKNSYNVYRINITANNGNTQYVTIGEMEFISSDSWETATTTTPTDTDFETYGMDDLGVITQTQWSDLASLDPTIEIVSYVPSGNVKNDFNIIYDDLVRTVDMNALPLGQIVIPSRDIFLYGSIKQFITSRLLDEKIEGDIKTLVSFDNGVKWEAYRDNIWDEVFVTSVADVKQNGMTMEELSNITQAIFDERTSTDKEVRIAYYIEEDIQEIRSSKIDQTELTQEATFDTPTLSDMSLYILNTTATINLNLIGDTLNGTLSDIDSSKVQYRVILNGNPYYPSDGSFSKLEKAPLEIKIRLQDYLIDQQNSLSVEFQDYWGKTDVWTTTFIGKYYGLIFTDPTGDEYATDIGAILKYLNVGTLIAGQVSTEYEINLRNDYGYSVINPSVTSYTDHSQVEIELSKSLSPFDAQKSLAWNQTLISGDSVKFYMRLVTQLTTPPTPSGVFQLRVNADKA